MVNNSKLIYIIFVLSDEDAEKLRKPIVGQGGYQSFLRSLQKELTSSNVIHLNPHQIRKIKEYAHKYGNGGFQQRLQGILNSLDELEIVKDYKPVKGVP